ncbi:MAG: pseudaminic acid synthase, partial [Candidatus Hydrogenedentes bacterium]|nr:pseudaminic acid synthase [Candidatus Hydrogenedentota bacterium]
AMVQAAAEAGADAIKLQTYTADTLTIDSDKPHFLIEGGTPWDGQTLYELYGQAYTPWEWHAELKAAAEECGLDFFSTPFDPTAVDFLEDLGVPLYKVASFENIDLPLLRKIAAASKPVIMSTGMMTLEELDESVEAFRDGGCEQLALLKCTSAYPAPPEGAHLRAIPFLAQRYGLPVGLSDHTLGTTVAVAAVALGACIVEKHFTLSRAEGGSDAAFSLEPGEFRALVNAIRTTEKSLGHAAFEPNEEETTCRIYRRSLFVVKDIKAGETFTADNVRSIRPGHGLPPKELDAVLERTAVCDIERGTPLSWEHVE